MRTDATILHEIDLVGDCDEVALGDGNDTFRAQARRQELLELRAVPVSL